MNIYTHRMSVGEGEYLSTYLPICLSIYLSGSVLYWWKNSSDNITEICHGLLATVIGRFHHDRLFFLLRLHELAVVQPGGWGKWAIAHFIFGFTH